MFIAGRRRQVHFQEVSSNKICRIRQAKLQNSNKKVMLIHITFCSIPIIVQPITH